MDSAASTTAPAAAGSANAISWDEPQVTTVLEKDLASGLRGVDAHAICAAMWPRRMGQHVLLRSCSGDLREGTGGAVRARSRGGGSVAYPR